MSTFFNKALPVLKYLDRCVSISLLHICYWITTPIAAMFVTKSETLLSIFSAWVKPQAQLKPYSFSLPKYKIIVRDNLTIDEKVIEVALDIFTWVALFTKEVIHVVNTYMRNVMYLMKHPFPNLDWNKIYSAKVSEKQLVTVIGSSKVRCGFNGRSGYAYYRAGDLFNLVAAYPIFDELCFHVNIGYDLLLTCEKDGTITVSGEQEFVFDIGFKHFNPESSN